MQKGRFFDAVQLARFQCVMKCKPALMPERLVEIESDGVGKR
jgi:hypothetical protein